MPYLNIKASEGPPNAHFFPFRAWRSRRFWAEMMVSPLVTKKEKPTCTVGV